MNESTKYLHFQNVDGRSSPWGNRWSNTFSYFPMDNTMSLAYCPRSNDADNLSSFPSSMYRVVSPPLDLLLDTFECIPDILEFKKKTLFLNQNIR